MERVELLNALRLVRDYCDGFTKCNGCVIRTECETNFNNEIINTVPDGWNLDDDV